MKEAFVGVDVACAKRKHLPISICRWDGGRLIPYPLRNLQLRPPRGKGNVAALQKEDVRAFAEDAAAYVREVASKLDLNVVRIGIDAPSAPAQGGRRKAEQAMDDAGVRCFATPTAEQFDEIRHKARRHLDEGGSESRIPHSNQLWMLVGFALFEELAGIAECVEVFPQATVCALGAGAIHKARAGGVALQVEAVAAHTGWPRPGQGDPELTAIAWAPAHDCLDAYLAAWVAALDESDRVGHGVPPDDVIWIPRVSSDASGTFGKKRAVVDQSPGSERSHSLLCPACGEKEFQRWPWGWDSHAAHTCSGLSRGTPAERKQEFRRRFATLF